MQSLTEDQTNRAFRLFYGEGMNLGQVAETLGCGLYALTPWLTAPSLRIAEQAITDSKTEKADAYAKLDNDSLDAIMEVIGSPQLYNSGKSAMRQWFLRRLRQLWSLPEPAIEEVPKRTRQEAEAHVAASNAQWRETKAVCDSQPVQAVYVSPEFDDLNDDWKTWVNAIVEVAQRRERERVEADADLAAARVRAEGVEADRAVLRDKVFRLRVALHDAIRRPMGVTPDSAAEFYDQRMADEAEARRADGGRL